jgi:hypothetical protein
MELNRTLYYRKISSTILADSRRYFDGPIFYTTKNAKRRYFVPYELIKGTDPLPLKEREYASAAEIKFTQFTSCIGVISRKGPTLSAVHLVIISGDIFGSDAIDVPTVLGQLPEPRDAVTIVGCIDVWQNPVNGKVLVAAFEKLTGSFKKLTKLCWGDGIYRAKIEGDAIKVFRGN